RIGGELLAQPDLADERAGGVQELDRLTVQLLADGVAQLLGRLGAGRLDRELLVLHELRVVDEQQHCRTAQGTSHKGVSAEKEIRNPKHEIRNKSPSGRTSNDRNRRATGLG